MWADISKKSIEKIKNYTKKKTRYYKEQDEEKVKTYNEKIKNIQKDKIVYLDETGIQTYIYIEYARAVKGEKVISRVSGRKYKRIGIIAARMGNKVIAPIEYTGMMNSKFFEQWFSEQLLPNIPKGSVIVMDNASFHRKKKLFAISEEQGYQIIFLPPYSPELNPIEHLWSNIKRKLQKILPEFLSFDDALNFIFQVL